MKLLERGRRPARVVYQLINWHWCSQFHWNEPLDAISSSRLLRSLLQPLIIPLSLSLCLSISFLASPSILVPPDQSPLHPVVPRSRRIVRNLWYRQTFSTVFAVSFLFIPSTLSSFLLFPPSPSLSLSFLRRFVHQSADWISTVKMRPY